MTKQELAAAVLFEFYRQKAAQKIAYLTREIKNTKKTDGIGIREMRTRRRELAKKYGILPPNAPNKATDEYTNTKNHSPRPPIRGDRR